MEFEVKYTHGGKRMKKGTKRIPSNQGRDTRELLFSFASSAIVNAFGFV